MKFTLKWPVVMITFIFTVSLIYGVNFWRQKNFVTEPLREDLLSLGIVEDVRIEEGKEKKIAIKLREVPHLALAYQDIEDVLHARHQADKSQIIILDQRNDYLNSLYETIHFAILEGERNGNYMEMNAEVSSLLSGEKGLDYSLFVDQERIYLKMVAQDAYLYEIIPIR